MNDTIILDLIAVSILAVIGILGAIGTWKTMLCGPKTYGTVREMLEDQRDTKHPSNH